VEVIYGLLPGMLIFGVITVAVLIWAAKSGQYDDLEGEASRILMDEDAYEDPPASSKAGGDDDGKAGDGGG
jgi:cbb3-type cytochrome oxidase maturation protein